MTSERPNPIALAETLRELAECWLELDRELTRSNGSASRGTSEGRVPLDLDVLEQKRRIDTFAHTYAHMLMDESRWVPAVTNAPYLLRELALHIGHFTHNPDALVAFEFEADLEKVSNESWAVANPDGKAKIPIGPCFAEGCTGTLHITIDRDSPLDQRELALWRPTAACYVRNHEGKFKKNPAAHRIDAKVYAANTPERGAEVAPV